MSYYNWKIEKNEENNTVSLHLELALRAYGTEKNIKDVTAPKIKVNLAQAVKHLNKNGIQVGRTLQNATVINTSDKDRYGTWIFELKAKPSQPAKTQQRKMTTSRKKRPPPSGTLTEN